ncbi:hypothetical protein M885DRAFT_506500 [Pelagophyceae sp. CCMP2097]|nr:hypothetical protein M885DRAFT_506500 [Pelagophyceae sp. CCMP2097]
MGNQHRPAATHDARLSDHDFERFGLFDVQLDERAHRRVADDPACVRLDASSTPRSRVGDDSRVAQVVGVSAEELKRVGIEDDGALDDGLLRRRFSASEHFREGHVLMQRDAGATLLLASETLVRSRPFPVTLRAHRRAQSCVRPKSTIVRLTNKGGPDDFERLRRPH